MTVVEGAGKNVRHHQSPPKVSAGTSPPKRAAPVSATLSSDTAPEDFDESAYLAAFPDVARSVKAGEFLSALQHYESNGQREGRLADPHYEALVRADTAGFPVAYVDKVYGCKDGQCLVLGWVNDDEQDPVSKLVLRNARGLRGSTTAFYRYIREDVAELSGTAGAQKARFLGDCSDRKARNHEGTGRIDPLGRSRAQNIRVSNPPGGQGKIQGACS